MVDMNDERINKEILRLKEKGIGLNCVDNLYQVARLTLSINELKKKRNAVIAAHVYQRSEIILGVSDFVGDSYKLAKECSKINADIMIFAGVKFMAETAKILNYDKKVFIPSMEAGCSLSDSITQKDVLELKKKYPDAPVVTYINTTAAVKAVCDVVVTSSNAEKILKKLFEKYQKIIFIPDKFMGRNLAKKLKKEVGKDIILWNGSCVVHENFDSEIIKEYRKKHPDMMVLAHSECPSKIIENSDFMGSTSDMIEQIRNTNASYYMLVTECGLGELAVSMFPDKKFIAMCRLCPYMKMITLENILYTLENLPKEREVLIEKDIAIRAKKAIDKMFEFS